MILKYWVFGGDRESSGDGEMNKITFRVYLKCPRFEHLHLGEALKKMESRGGSPRRRWLLLGEPEIKPKVSWGLLRRKVLRQG